MTSPFHLEKATAMTQNNHNRATGAGVDQFQRLLDIMARLRGDEGCPWDMEQDHRSLQPYLIEEAFEVIETIEEGNPQRLCEELGDLLLQIVFHSRIAQEKGDFDIEDVCRAISNKLIRRHPHIFGNVTVSDSREVLKNWEEIKMQEKAGKPRRSLLEGIPKSMPALLYARRLQERAAQVGFDWPDVDGVLDKVAEEIEELREALNEGDKEHASREMGDLLFALVNISRWINANPEEALRNTAGKFIRRFGHIEDEARNRQQKLSEMSLDQMEEIWQDSKTKE